ncbi:hypothetical protein [Streptomyces mobaraensis]|uniref:Uncharacterized protein n=1 Tax=Streptomyces mobaraensis TaxID=35621 RepID=A0A5N5VWY8_STRMB|nr:hypothetical protein [Streptomyces mobaraensis]KAB7833092.1 hypothetical protein FRZ00_34190 [Streptomyces mobaraensis]
MRLSMKTAVIASTALLGLGAAAPAIAAQECAVKQSTTAQYDCGQFGVLNISLEGSAENGVGSLYLSNDQHLFPVDIPADSTSTSLTLQRPDGSTVTFSGTSNPAIPANTKVTVGPLKAQVKAGDKLDSYIPAAGSSDVSARLSILGVNNTCKAVTKQTPGPFSF